MAVESIQKRFLLRLPSLSAFLLEYRERRKVAALVRDTFDGEEIAVMNTIMSPNLKRYGYAL